MTTAGARGIFSTAHVLSIRFLVWTIAWNRFGGLCSLTKEYDETLTTKSLA